MPDGQDLDLTLMNLVDDADQTMGIWD